MHLPIHVFVSTHLICFSSSSAPNQQALQREREKEHKPLIDIDTPADKTLKMLDKLIKGQPVDAHEAEGLREAILNAGDLHMPVNFNQQLMSKSNTKLDAEVSKSLIQLLSSKQPARIEEETEEDLADGPGGGLGDGKEEVETLEMTPGVAKLSLRVSNLRSQGSGSSAGGLESPSNVGTPQMRTLSYSRSSVTPEQVNTVNKSIC